jgi:HD superfamily phosphohydrolase
MDNLAFNYSNVSIPGIFKTDKSRTVFDAIHGHLTFDSYVWDVIDTLPFQRLRNLKQIGNGHYVFPSATHSRFEHSIGVAYLSNKVFNHLCPNKEDYRYYEKVITLAGLCHDLGHGPFSHLFDRFVIKTLK